MLVVKIIFCGKGWAMDCLNPFLLFLLRRELIITWFGGKCESELFSCRECSGGMLLDGELANAEISPFCAFVSEVLIDMGGEFAESKGFARLGGWPDGSGLNFR